MTPESVSASELQPSGMSELSRLSGVFFEPQKAFGDIAERPSFWVPLILVMVSSILFTVMMGQYIGWQEIMRQGNPRQAQQFEQMPPEQRQKAEEMQAKIGPAIGYASSVLGPPIGILVIAGVMLGIVRGILSAPIRFKQMYAIFCYTSLPGVLQTALKAVVLVIKKQEFNLLNPLAFNPAVFMDSQTSSKFVYSLAKSFDLFTLWTIALIVIGIKAAAGKKLSYGAAAAAVVVPWLAVIFIGASLAGLFS